MSFYIVVYTAAHLIGAVSGSLDLDQCAAMTDHFTERNSRLGETYTFECEEHDKPPKRQTKINVKDREFFESFCVTHGINCHEHPNGDIEYHSSAHCSFTIAKEDRENPNAKPIKSTCPWDRK